MSSKYVRDMVKGWLEDVSMAVPYYHTINEEQDPQEDIWCTADFSGTSRDTLTFCNNSSLEEGEIEVIYQGKAGVGEDPLLTALEADIITLMAQRDLAGKLILTQRSTPFEFSGGSADRWYGLSIFIEYQFYE